MGVKFACHQCGKPLNVKNDLAGKRGKCPQCGSRFRIPTSDQPFSIPLDESLGGSDEEDEEFQSGGDGVSSATPPLPSQPVPGDSVLAGPASSEPAQSSRAPNSVIKPSEPQSPATGTAEPPPADDAFDPLDDPGAQWYVRPPNGGRYGPADGQTIRQWIKEGRVTQTTLLWRDGWAQWRDCDEIIPEAFQQQSVAPPQNPPPPAVPPGASSPAFDMEATQKTMSGSAPGGRESGADAYLGSKKRRRTRQRVTLISILAGVALILVVALVVALVWPR